jgi:TonB-dependent starch-binding outer membrane protein SusC
MARRKEVVAVLALAALIGACGPKVAHNSPRRDARLITHEQIEKSGANDAFEALKRVGTFLTISDRKNVVRASQRGRASFLLSPQMLLVVDGVMMADLNALKAIPAESVDSMRVMTGMEATPMYGTQGSNGVLVVTTRIPAS